MTLATSLLAKVMDFEILQKVIERGKDGTL